MRRKSRLLRENNNKERPVYFSEVESKILKSIIPKVNDEVRLEEAIKLKLKNVKL